MTSLQEIEERITEVIEGCEFMNNSPRELVKDIMDVIERSIDIPDAHVVRMAEQAQRISDMGKMIEKLKQCGNCGKYRRNKDGFSNCVLPENDFKYIEYDERCVDWIQNP